MNREMKDSGVEWIGNIPTEWTIYKMKNLTESPLSYGANSSGIDYDTSLPRYIRITDISGDNKLKNENKLSLSSEDAKAYILKNNDLLFARSGGTVGKTFLYKEHYGQAAFAGYLIKASFNNEILAKWVYLYSLSQGYNEWKNRIFIRSTIQNIGASKYSNMEVAMPEKASEKEKIINFLEIKLPHIDSIIEKTKSTIEDYKLLKQSIITEAVTKGLDKNVEMKDSGIEWIGEIPRHWDLSKLKYEFRIKKDIAGKEGFNVLSVTQGGLKIKDININEGQMAADYSKYQFVRKNDYIMNHMDLLTGWVDYSIYDGVTSPDYRVFNMINPEKNSHEYYKYIFQTCYKNKIFYGMAQGVSNLGRWRLQADKFLNFHVPIPPKEEQYKIADYIVTEQKRYDDIISKKVMLLSELEEYKKSLIYEYITGKKEVMYREGL